MNTQTPHRRYLTIGVYSFLVLLGIAFSIGPSDKAAADDLQVSPLPTRITPTPSPTPPLSTVTPSAAASGEAPAGYIELTLIDYDQPQKLWTELEWRTRNGKWIMIQDGWQGHPEAEGEVRWLVGEELLGSDTLFRWRVYTSEDGGLLDQSSTFKMPQRSGETRAVVIQK
ncbi:MAG: hypothetical protein AAF633_19100 [Chloroflexota bacterium]